MSGSTNAILKRMSGGGDSGGSGIFWITITISNDGSNRYYVLDKTYNEIKEAVTNGLYPIGVQAKGDSSGAETIYMPLTNMGSAVDGSMVTLFSMGAFLPFTSASADGQLVNDAGGK